MKLSFLMNLYPNGMSPPSRGAWIEIEALNNNTVVMTRSPPSRGAWIEIDATIALTISMASPPSRGAGIEIGVPR